MSNKVLLAVPGPAVYEAIVCLTAIRDALQGLSPTTDVPLVG